jgi:4-amino-4-deoxy-L-arabinose transferase-like glycosyltransferase
MPHSRALERRFPSAAAVLPLVFIGAWAFRFLSMGALENDHFVALARAHQVLRGGWPIRDFADPGQPLAYLTSAAAAALFGPTLLTDVVLSVTLLALAAALTYWLAVRASGSVLIALAAVALQLAAAPRLYNAGKVLLPLTAVWLGWRYIDRPSVARLIAIAGTTAIAFLWRHDHAVYIAPPTIALLFLIHDRPKATRLTMVYVAACAILLLPWLGYVQWAQGIGAYTTSAMRFAATEAERTVGWPHAGAPVVVFVTLVGTPIVALALAWRGTDRLTFTQVAYVAAIALIANVVLLRDVIATRMPDVMALTVVLGAWIAGRVASKSLMKLVAGVALVAIIAGITVRLRSQGYGIPTPAAVVRRLMNVSVMLRAGDAAVIPNRERVPLVRYLASCTATGSRVLVSGFGPEISVLADRPFAAGLPTFVPGYYTDASDVERASAQLSKESVSLAVMLEGSTAFAEAWPQIASDLRSRGLVERTWQLDGTELVVWVPEDVAARSPSGPPSCDAR